MSLEIIKEDSPIFPFTSPLADSFRPGDELELVASMKPNSCICITFKSGDAEKDVSQISLGLSITVDNKLVCKWGKNNKEEEVQVERGRKFENETFCMKISVFNNKYHVLVVGVRTFSCNYLPFESDTLAIDTTGKTSEISVKSVLLTRPMRWLAAKTDSPTPAFAFKCGKDEFNNAIYLGHASTYNKSMIVSVIPSFKKATAAFNGQECPIGHYELLEHSCYYGWKLIGKDKKIPEKAVNIGLWYNMHYIGRAKIKGAVIPGTLDKDSNILSIPFKGKEVKISSGYEVLVVLSPLEVKKEPPRAPVKVKPPQNNQDCVICYAQEITTAFNPCGHLGFCESCAIQLLAWNDKCPICNTHIESYLRTYKVV